MVKKFFEGRKHPANFIQQLCPHSAKFSVRQVKTEPLHQKDWLTYSVGTDKPSELCYNFSILSDLTQMVNFHTQIPQIPDV